MTIQKRPLVVDRIRSLPPVGWSWIDRRFLGEHAERLGGDDILLYFFLAAVSDKVGLSYYSDRSISTRIRIGEGRVVSARGSLEYHDLIAYEAPLYQVLSLPRHEGKSRAYR